MRPMGIFCGPSDTPFLKNIYLDSCVPVWQVFSLLALRGLGAPRVRWLSLNVCVQRLADLLPEIVSYFELEAHNILIRWSERANLQELYDKLVDPKFQLYLYFLQGRLPILAGINIQLQTKGQDLFTSYQKIADFKKTFLKPMHTL